MPQVQKQEGPQLHPTTPQRLEATLGVRIPTTIERRVRLHRKRRRTTVLTSDEVVSTSFVNGHDLLSGCVCYWVESSAAESFNPRFQGNNSAIRLTGWSAMRSST